MLVKLFVKFSPKKAPCFALNFYLKSRPPMLSVKFLHKKAPMLCFTYSTAQRRCPLPRRSELARALIVNIYRVHQARQTWPNSGGVAEGHPRFDKGGVAIIFYFLRVKNITF